MPRIHIVGPGAIGTVALVHLELTGRHALLACARRPAEGFVLESPRAGRREIRVPVITDPAEAGPADWILIATKSHQTEGASPWFAKALGPATRVAVLQNGVEHGERVASFAAGAEVVPVIVDCPATRDASGQVLQARAAIFRVARTDAGEAFQALFAGSEVEVELVEDFRTVAWTKLCFNAIGGALTTLTDRSLGVLREESIAVEARALALECIAVARAEGARIEDSFAATIVERLAAGRPEAVNSLLADRRAGRTLEWEARNGAIVRFGGKHGIATPRNRLVCALLEAMSLGPRPDEVS